MKSKNIAPELVVRRIVHRLGFRYRLHAADLPGAPDLVFPRLKKIVIVNGCFWHMHTCGACRIPASRRSYWIGKIRRNRLRDLRTRRALARLGWRVLVVWECQTKAARRARLEAKLVEFLTRDWAGIP